MGMIPLSRSSLLTLNVIPELSNFHFTPYENLIDSFA